MYNLDYFFAPPKDKFMKSDLEEKEDMFILQTELPGVSKDDVKAEFKDGRLTISASKKASEEKKKNSYIIKETFEGTCKRSFYIGDNIKEEDIKASFENGILRFEIPKEKKEETKKLIEIE